MRDRKKHHTGSISFRAGLLVGGTAGALYFLVWLLVFFRALAS